MEDSIKIEERELLVRLKQGEESALTQLMKLYKRPLSVSMYRMLKSDMDTEEALQELFVRVWKHRANIDVDRPIKNYLFTIAGNLVLDMLRKSAQEKRLIANYLIHVTEIYTHVEERIFDEETRDLIKMALEAMPEQRRRVFELCRIQGFSYQEVSDQLGISVATVNSHMTNAHLFLKKYFGDRPDLTAVILASLMVLHVS